MERWELLKTKMSHDEWLWDVFKEFWPPWAEHVEVYENFDDNAIQIHFKEDGYVTNGTVYIFGSKGDDSWYLTRIQGPVKREAQ